MRNLVLVCSLLLVFGCGDDSDPSQMNVAGGSGGSAGEAGNAGQGGGEAGSAGQGGGEAGSAGQGGLSRLIDQCVKIVSASRSIFD